MDFTGSYWLIVAGEIVVEVVVASPDRQPEPPTRGSAPAVTSSKVGWLNLRLRALMETGIVLGLAYWGYQTGLGVFAKVALAIAAPGLGFGFLGAVDLHEAARAAERLRLLEELVASGLVAVALWNVGQPILGLLMVALSIVYHSLVYATGGRLVKPHLQTA